MDVLLSLGGYAKDNGSILLLDCYIWYIMLLRFGSSNFAFAALVSYSDGFVKARLRTLAAHDTPQRYRVFLGTTAEAAWGRRGEGRARWRTSPGWKTIAWPELWFLAISYYYACLFAF